MKKNESGDKARVKFRYIEFDVEGGSPAIQDGLRHIASALTRAAPQPRALPRAAEPTRRGAEAPVNGELPFSPPLDAADAETEADVTPEAPSSDPKPRAPRKYSAPSILNGLKLDGNPSLQEFVDEKAPDGHNARYLVAAVWLKREKNISEFTADHAFTIYKLLGWGSTPKDPGMPLRALKRDSLMESGEKPGTYVVNDAGEAKVDRMPGA